MQRSVAQISVRNRTALRSEMWGAAKADGYTQIDPFCALVLPETGLIDEPSLTLDEMQAVIEAAEGPLRTYYGILAETGIPCGEACGLPVRNLLLDEGAIAIRQKVWHGKIEPSNQRKGIASAKLPRNWWSICGRSFVPGFTAILGDQRPGTTAKL